MTVPRGDTMDAALGLVVASSLLLLVFGLDATPGRIALTQLPTTLAQLLFVVLASRQVDYQSALRSLPAAQRYLLLALLVYVAVVSFGSAVPSSPILGPAWIVHILFLVAVILHARLHDLGTGTQVWQTLGVVAALHVFAFLVAWILWPDTIRAGVLPAFDNIRHLGYFLAPAAAVMAVQYVLVRGSTWLSLVCFAATSFYLIYTGSRGGAVALVAALVLIYGYCVWYKLGILWRRVMILLGTVIVLSVLAELLPPLPWATLFGRGVDAMDQTGQQLLSGRGIIWGLVVDAIKENWGFGYGPGFMGQIQEFKGPPFRHPHNIGLQLLLHWGVVGTVLVLVALGSFGGNVWRAIRHAPVQTVAPLSALLTMGIHALVDGGLYYPYSTAIAVIAVASLEGIGRQTRADDASPVRHS